MTMNRDHNKRGARQRAPDHEIEQNSRDSRRADMQASEGHAGSIPRGNQQTEHENLGRHHWEWERLLGH